MCTYVKFWFSSFLILFYRKILSSRYHTDSFFPHSAPLFEVGVEPEFQNNQTSFVLTVGPPRRPQLWPADSPHLPVSDLQQKVRQNSARIRSRCDSCKSSTSLRQGRGAGGAIIMTFNFSLAINGKKVLFTFKNSILRFWVIPNSAYPTLDASAGFSLWDDALPTNLIPI